MNNKEMSENSGNEADVSEKAEESINETDASESAEESISEGDTPETAESPKPLNLAPETVDQVWRYSKIPVSQVPEHWSDVLRRNRKIAADPNFGLAWFTECTIIQSPVYEKMLGRVLEGDRLFELGCGFGQNIRRLFLDGAEYFHLSGFDMNKHLIQAGYDLFQDRGRIPMTFFSGNIMAASSTSLRLNGTFNIVFANMFFHLFDWAEQIAIAKRVITLLRSEPGSMVFGQSIGHMEPGLYSVGRQHGKKGYAHDTRSLQQMWDLVGSETKSNWHVQGILEVNENIATFTQDDHARCLRFWIRRIPYWG